MKENYWIQNEERFRRQRESDEELKLKHDKQRKEEDKHEREQRRFVWQRLAKRRVKRASSDCLVTNENRNENKNHSNSNKTHTPASDETVKKLSDESRRDENKTEGTIIGHKEEHDDVIGCDKDDVGHKSSSSFRESFIDGHQDEDDDAAAVADKRRQEEILQLLADEQKRLFSEERQQMKRQSSQQVKRDENELNLSFCGCGFLGIYHVGVASCFHEYAPQLSMHKISGSSAGALVAVAHICGNLQLAYATTDILRVAIDARARTLGPFHPSFDINALVREALEKGLPEDVHLKANGKLHVSLTRVYDGENVIVSEFDSKEDVIQVLLCSCFIPFWSGLKAPKYKGVTYIDGGFSNNLLTLDDKTVTVSPFSGEADICPQDDTLNLLQVNLSNTSFSLSPNNLYRLSHALLPPPPEILSDLCEQGFADGIRFLQQMKLISCTKCLEIRSSLLVTTNGEDMEEAFTSEVEEAVAADPSALDGCAGSISGGADHEARLRRFSIGSTASGVILDDTCHHPHIILEQQEQKTIEINSATGQRRDSIRSTTSQVFLQQHQHSADPSKQQHHLDSMAEQASRFRRSSSLWQLYHANSCSGSDDNDNNNNKEDADSMMAAEGDNANGSLASCDECVQMRQRALNQAMPEQFSDRIREACDTVNKSLSNWIYSHRPIKYLSYLAAPYFLPLDITLALVHKCWRQLPFMRSELTDCIQNLVGFLIGIMRRMHARSTSTLLLESSFNWMESNSAIEYEKELIKKQPLAVAQVAAECKASDNINNDRHQQAPSSNRTSASSNATTTTSSESHFSLKITTDGVCLSKQSRTCTSNGRQQQQPHSLEDTFDSIVDVTSNQEARIFAYYFRDAKNRLQVTEIFDYERANNCTNNTTSGQSIDSSSKMQLPKSQQHLQQPPVIGALPAPTSDTTTTTTMPPQQQPNYSITKRKP